MCEAVVRGPGSFGESTFYSYVAHLATVVTWSFLEGDLPFAIIVVAAGPSGRVVRGLHRLCSIMSGCFTLSFVGAARISIGLCTLKVLSVHVPGALFPFL